MNGLILRAVIVLAAFSPPALQAISRLHSPRTREEMKPVLAYISDHSKKGDVVYVYHAARDAFRYYSRQRPLTAAVAYGVRGQKNPTVYELDLRMKLAGHARAWILFSHSLPVGPNFLLTTMKDLGRRIDAVEAPGVAGYLYELDSTPAGR